MARSRSATQKFYNHLHLDAIAKSLTLMRLEGGIA